MTKDFFIFCKMVVLHFLLFYFIYLFFLNWSKFLFIKFFILLKGTRREMGVRKRDHSQQTRPCGERGERPQLNEEEEEKKSRKREKGIEEREEREESEGQREEEELVFEKGQEFDLEKKKKCPHFVSLGHFISEELSEEVVLFFGEFLIILFHFLIFF